MSCDRFIPLLDAYRDGELPPEDHRQMAAHVAGCMACTARLNADEAIGRVIRERGRVEVPSDLNARVLAALDREDHAARVHKIVPLAPPPSRMWARAAAVVLACALSAAVGWQAALMTANRDQAVDEVVAAHVRALVQDNPIQVASSDTHTVRPWFAGRIDVAPNAVDLSAQGFPLVGGRLDVIGGRRVAVVVYKRRAHWVNVYAWPAGDAPDSAPVVIERNGFNTMKWTRGGVTNWAVSDLNLTELKQLQAML